MFLDDDQVLSDGQAVTADARSTKTFHGQVANRMGLGNPLYLIIQVTKAFTAGNGTINLRSHTAEPTAPNQGTVHASAAFSAAEMQAVGTRKEVLIPPSADVQRYVFAQYDMAANGADGEFSTWISTKTEGYQYIRSGFTVAGGDA